MFKKLNTHLGLCAGATVLLLYSFVFSFDFCSVFGSWDVSRYFQWNSDGTFLFYLFKQTNPQITALIFFVILAMFVAVYFLEKRKALLVQLFGSGVLIYLIADLSSLIFFVMAHFLTYELFHGHLCKNIFAPYLRKVIVQLPLFYILYLIFISVVLEKEIHPPLAALFFCWQWVRLYIYQLDYQDGLIPSRLSFLSYLSVFLSPGSVVSYDFGHYVGQGYQYTVERHHHQEINHIALSGAKLLAIALGYVVLAKFISLTMTDALTNMGLPVSHTVSRLNQRYVAGENLSSLNILLSCIIAQLNWFILFAGALHAKVGLWRLFGYNFEPQFNKFWLATNMVSLWQRYTYHFRLTLVRVAYFPVFFFLKKFDVILRVSAATFASAGLANMIWAHVPAYFLYYGFTVATWESLPTWPYYFLLSSGILVCEIYLLKRKKRPKNKNSFLAKLSDVASFAMTFSYFSLIHIFARPVAGGSLQDYANLFLKGLGLSIFFQG